VIAIATPLLTIQGFAEVTSQTVDAVTKQIERGILPTVQPMGKNTRKFINMVALTEHLASVEYNKSEWNQAAL